jgi:hypothetical protein
MKIKNILIKFRNISSEICLKDAYNFWLYLYRWMFILKMNEVNQQEFEILMLYFLFFVFFYVDKYRSTTEKILIFRNNMHIL